MVRDRLRRRLPLLLLIPFGVTAQCVAAHHPAVADAYATSIYPTVSWIYVWITGLIPVSFAEILSVLLVVWLVAVGARNIGRLRRDEVGRWELFWRFEISALTWLSLIYVLFVVWGINYHRTPLASFAGLDSRRTDPSELRALCSDLADQVNGLRMEVDEDGSGVMKVSSSRHAALSRARAGFEAARHSDPALFRGHAGRAKGLYLLATPMSVFGADGIFLMWTGEPSVNMNLPDPAIPFSACHEIAHQLGWAREDEASFVGYLACVQHPDPAFRYSGSLAALGYALAALRRTDPESASDLAERLDPAVRRDQTALAAYSRRYRSRFQALAKNTYDVYLKSQGQKAGRASYGMMVDLLLAYRRGREIAMSEPGGAQELDRHPGASPDGEVGQNFAQNRRELEPVSRESCRESDPLFARMATDQKVTIGRTGVHAGSMGLRSNHQAG